MYPVVRGDVVGLILVTLIFDLTTIGTILLVVFTSLKDFKYIPLVKSERYMIH
jgi:hypothetical protein